MVDFFSRFLLLSVPFEATSEVCGGIRPFSGVVDPPVLASVSDEISRAKGETDTFVEVESAGFAGGSAVVLLSTALLIAISCSRNF